MAWFDIVGGLAGGLQQGLGQLQQAQQAKQVEARQQALLEIQQAQEQRAGEAAKRQADQERLEMFKQLLTGEDPLNVSGQTMSILQQKYADLVPTSLVKNTETGQFEVKMPPEQRAALTKARNDAQIAAQLQERVANLPTLSKDEALRAVKLGKMDPSLVYSKLDPKDRESFLGTLYLEEAFKSQQALNRALRVEGAKSATAKEATLTPQAQLNLVTSLQTAAENNVRAAEKMLNDFKDEFGTPPPDSGLAQELKDLERAVNTARQQALAVDERVRTYVAQNPDLAKVRSLFPSQPAPAPAGVVAPQAGNPFRK